MNTVKLLGRIFIATVSLLLITGCAITRYEYVAPPTDHGRYCAAQCAAIKDSCQGNEVNRAQYEYNSCQQRSEYQYRDCLHHARSDDEAKRCRRQACWNNPNTWRCDENYRQCFVGCGGIVHTTREQ